MFCPRHAPVWRGFLFVLTRLTFEPNGVYWKHQNQTRYSTMRKIYVYAGYYELFVSSKPMAAPYMYQAEFDTVSEAEKWLDENFDTENDTVFYERSIYNDSRLADYPLDEENAEAYKFDVGENGEMIYKVESC